jgi:hypothetical protein
MEILLGLLWWIILFPVIWLVSAPFILVIAVFRSQGYPEAVADMFGAVHRFWEKWGFAFLP